MKIKAVTVMMVALLVLSVLPLDVRGIIGQESTEADVLIVDDWHKRAFFGWYRASQMPPTGWDLLNKTILWADGYMHQNETRIVFFTFDGTVDHTDPNEDAATVYDWLISIGYLDDNIDVRHQSDAETLSPDYYDEFNLIIYWNTNGYNPVNIVASGVPFITVSVAQTNEMGIGTGETTMHQSRDTFYVVNTDYYPTQDYPRMKLTFESEMWFKATEATAYGRVLIKAEVVSLVPEVEASLTQDIGVLEDGSGEMSFVHHIPQSPLADMYREAFFEGQPPFEPDVEYDVPENKTVVETTPPVEEDVEDTSLVGDCNADDKVNILDLAAIAKDFGCRIDSSNYEPQIDLDASGQINILDISLAAKNFGKTKPPPEESEEPVREVFHQSIIAEQLTLLGFDMAVFDSKIVPWGSNNETRISWSTYAPQLAVLVGADWKISVGPPEVIDNATEIATEFTATKIHFTQMLLQSWAGEQVYVFDWSMRITLPSEAQIINSEELDGLNWTIDFGGGTLMEAYIALDLGEVIVNEKMVVTEQNITATEEYLGEAFSDYKVFKIVYSLGPPASQTVKKQSAYKLKDDWSKTWSYTIERSRTTEWSRGPLYVRICIRAKLKTTWYLGWQFETHWNWWPKVRLKWFKTWMSIEPSITTSIYVEATASYTKTFSRTFNVYSKRFWFWIGCVPVWANLKVSATVGVTVSAYGSITFSMSVTAYAWYKAGVRWDRSTGWQGTWEHGSGASKTGPAFSTSAGISATPFAECRLEFLVYDVAGPFVTAGPRLNISISVNSNRWSISVQFKVCAGATLAGWLKNLLKGLGSWSKCWSWTLTSWSGS